MNILTRELAAQVEMILYKYLGYCYSVQERRLVSRADLQPKDEHLDKEAVQSTGWECTGKWHDALVHKTGWALPLS